MARHENCKAMVWSQWVFARLLAAYPKEHRREYGPAMAQLFRDQCRDATRKSGTWGIARLWLRVFPDLLKTSFLERLAAFGEGKSMLKRILRLHPDSSPVQVFLKVFAAIFIVVFVAGAASVWSLPDVYLARARVKLQSLPPGGYDPFFMQKQFDLMYSNQLLDQVLTGIALNQAWAAKSDLPSGRPNARAREKLRHMIDLRPVRNTSLVDISVYDQDAKQAAKIANALAAALRDYHLSTLQGTTQSTDTAGTVEFVETALPNLRPVHRRMPVNFGAAGLVAVLLAFAGGLMAALLVGRASRRPPAIA